MPANPSWKEHLDALPLRTPDEVVGARNLLVIAPHPDDESLGCGGLLAWAAASGRKARVAMLTDGEASHPGSARFPPSRLAALRRTEALHAGAWLGLAPGDHAFLHLPDGALGALAPAQRETAIQALAAWMRELTPVVACVTASSDMHGDHRAAHRLARAAARRVPGCTLLAYPVWSWLAPAATRPPPGWRIDVGRYRAAKRAAIRSHASQHGGLIDDAPEPFELPAALLACVDRDYEVLLDEPV